MELWGFQNYKSYLLSAFNAPESPRGARTRLAHHLGVQTAYVSQVLNGHPNFSLEQGLKAAEFLRLSSVEKDYFILLIEKERAGTQELQLYFDQKCEKMIQEQSRIKNRLTPDSTLDDKTREHYYSQWQYSALHVLASIPSAQTPEVMTKMLRLPFEKIQEALDFLQEVGLLSKEGTRYKIGPMRLHLPDDSPSVIKHHMNWRLEAMKSLERNESQSHLHYSSVMTLSQKDAQKIKGMLLEMISKAEAVMLPSPEEKLVALCLDWFDYKE